MIVSGEEATDLVAAPVEQRPSVLQRRRSSLGSRGSQEARGSNPADGTFGPDNANKLSHFGHNLMD